MLEGKRRAGYAVVTNAQPFEPKALPSNTSAQKAELIALARALEFSHGKRVFLYIYVYIEILNMHLGWYTPMGQFGREGDG